MHIDGSGIIAADDYDIENLKCPLCNFKLVYIKCDDGDCKLVCPRNYKNKSCKYSKIKYMSLMQAVIFGYNEFDISYNYLSNYELSVQDSYERWDKNNK